MRYLIDTNILISAALFPDSIPAKAFMRAVTPPHNAVVCDYTMEEMRRVFNRKFPHKIADYERFISMLAVAVELIPTPTASEENLSDENELMIRDLHDRPIFRAAVKAMVDGIITGDKDFLDSGIHHPKMIAPADFIRLNQGKVSS